MPFAPGGGGDLAGRLYGKFLSNLLPGKPSVVVRNMPGGAATIGANFVYAAKPDGLTAMVAGGSVPLNQLVGLDAVKYDVYKMPAVVSSGTGAVFYVSKGVTDKPENILKAKGLKFGGSGGVAGYLGVTAIELLKLPMEKVVLGYSSAPDARRAFLSGEVNMAYDSTAGYNESILAFVEKGEVLPLFQVGLFNESGDIVRAQALPQILSIKELYEKLHGSPPSGVVWDTYKTVVGAARVYANVLSLPPGTPDAIVKAYGEAASKMVKDPEFLKLAEPITGAGSVWMAGESLDKQYKLSLGMKPEIKDWLLATLKKYGLAAG